MLVGGDRARTTSPPKASLVKYRLHPHVCLGKRQRQRPSTDAPVLAPNPLCYPASLHRQDLGLVQCHSMLTHASTLHLLRLKRSPTAGAFRYDIRCAPPSPMSPTLTPR